MIFLNKERPKERDCWNRCDVCGRFIAHDDFGSGATRDMRTPDSDLTWETWETTCKRCNNEMAM